MWPELLETILLQYTYFYGSFHKLFELPVSLANQMWMFCKHLLPPIGHHHLQLHFLECNKWRVNSYLSYAPIVDKLEHMQLQLSSVMQVGQHQNLQECLRRKARHNQPKIGRLQTQAAPHKHSPQWALWRDILRRQPGVWCILSEYKNVNHETPTLSLGREYLSAAARRRQASSMEADSKKPNLPVYVLM